MIPYNPHKNGVVEHMNRTLLNMVRSMMFFKNVKLMFLGEVVLCVVYIQNQCPSTTINNKSPYEMWHTCLPTIQHFRVFGSTCYALIHKQQHNKLDGKSHKCIFLGYSNTSRAYRLYNEDTKRFIVSRDVYFLNLIKMPPLLIKNSVIWISSPLANFIMNGLMIFCILKGGFLF